jgi:hypothetical protein
MGGKSGDERAVTGNEAAVAAATMTAGVAAAAPLPRRARRDSPWPLHPLHDGHGRRSLARGWGTRDRCAVRSAGRCHRRDRCASRVPP